MNSLRYPRINDGEHAHCYLGAGIESSTNRNGEAVVSKKVKESGSDDMPTYEDLKCGRKTLKPAFNVK